MRYSILTLATVLAQTQAQTVPMPFGLGSVPVPVGEQNSNVGGINGQGYSPSMAAQQSMAKPSSSMMPQRPAQSHGVNHYYMTPMASSSASHYINRHMSMYASASGSMPYSASATPSARAGRVHGLNHAVHAPHAHEGFAAPAGIPKAGDSVSYNGATTKKGGYHGGNGNGFTQTHGDDSSSDGTPPLMMSPQRGATPTTPEYEHAANVNENIAPIPNSAPGGQNIAPIGNPMAPGSNVAPVLPQKSHGIDEGNGFCLGQCYETPGQAKCAKPYSSPVYNDGAGCYTCCITSPDF